MKSFYNDAIIGNSRILAALDDKSRFLRIFWPHIDSDQGIEKMLLGIYFPNISNTMYWLDSHEWQYAQYYVEDTNILKTMITSYEHQIKITFTDFVLQDRDIIIRNVEFENTSDSALEVNLTAYCSGTSSKMTQGASLFDYESDSVVIFRRDNYMFLSSNKECTQFQLTNNPFDAANRLSLYGVDDYSLSPEGTMIWEAGEVKPGKKASMNLYLTFSNTLNSGREAVERVKKEAYKELLRENKDYWDNYLKSARQINTGTFDIDSLYRRSLLVLKLLSDETGGIIAAPEMDEEHSKSGGYGYCWGRDAAFITTAMDRVGLQGLSKKFYEWSLKAQDGSGAWHQRYYVDGNLAPGWGLQIDETGGVLWGMWHYYSHSKDKAFLEMVWESVYKGAEYLTKTIDRNVGLPKVTYDLWEERAGQHSYSSSAVYGGLIAASNMARELGKDTHFIDKWYLEAENIKMAIEKKLWSESQERFLRSINVKLNPWGSEQGEVINMVVNKKGYVRDFSLKDEVVDSSLIGLTVPFNVFDPNDTKIQNTVKAIEERLSVPQVGGIKRYENDNYIGGNPWIITTLWLALYYIKCRKFDSAKSLLFWASNHKTKLGLLPEQIDKNNGSPAWVIPLTWSHAMYIHVLLDLVDNNEI